MVAERKSSRSETAAPEAGRETRRVLLIEDDEGTAREILAELADCGFAVEHAADGKTGLEKARRGDVDVMIVDRLLPGLDGLTLIEYLREERLRTPVLVLSALGSVDDRVRGLHAGGDDYLVKPFSFDELVARVSALGRRPADSTPETRLRVADLELDLLSRTVIRAGRVIVLHPREFRLLEYLMRNAGQVVTRKMLLEKVWNYRFDPQTNLVDAHLSRLRSKIDKGFASEMIHTVRGSGYCLRAAG